MCVGSGKCRCDAGYSGTDCSTITTTLPNSFKQSFDGSGFSPKDWLLIEGGSIGKDCGILGSGSSLVFKTAVHRQAITVDIDTRMAR